MSARDESAPETRTRDGRPWRVLVVDDNRDIVTVIPRLLKSKGYDTLTAEDGKEALEKARAELPDLVLLDWMLPGIDGLDVCRQLKAEVATRGIMIVMVTGRGSVHNRIEGFDAGADDFIPKPFHHPELLARVRSALRIKELTDELSERNRQLVDSQNELVRQEKMATIGLLASGIAHEFNNIMAGISGYAQLAKRDEKYMPQLVEVALTQASRAEELTYSLSSYHREGTGEIGCDVNDVVQRSFCLVKKMIESRGISLDFEPATVAPASISAGQLQEVVLNMLLNAVHATKGGGSGSIRVFVGQSEPPGAVRISIADDGEGIAAENLKHIFDPFFTTKGALGGGSDKGTGLGLSVCYNIVQSRGGKIEVESEPGEGTTFTVTIPAHEGALPYANEEEPFFPAHQAPQETSDLRVLVVDDEAPIRAMIGEFLSSLTVRLCATGEEAVAAYRDEPFDYVILDLCMENSQNGVETFRQIRSLQPDAKIILASGRLPEEIPEDVIDSAHGHLLKPFKLQALGALLGVPLAV